MPVYTVHAPLAATGEAAADKAEFVRDGFHFWAFVGGVFWLIGHRLWLASLGYAVLVAALLAGMAALRVSGDARLAALVLVALLMGHEAASLRRWTLSRGRWRQLDVVVADSEEAAERRFFDRRSAGASDLSTRGAIAPAYAAPAGVLGSFPEPGGLR
jgi:hypothetical protein